ncbi:MAG: PadR family transcriptional regulator [Oscillospiraceae bacterium]|nr:PadR family transcriptional regulator [Oscillospiraceae bacterium]MDD4369271.1 PadR family transcriptional regulator [Oscillospiraceae bacterium]
MNPQLKKGLCDYCVLALLQRSDSYGYQLIKDLEPVLSLSESTLYPILRRLEQAACLSTYSREHQGRLRKYYRITPAGQARLAEARQDWEDLQQIYRFILRPEAEDQQ